MDDPAEFVNSPVGKHIQIEFFGDTYTGVVDTVYGASGPGEETYRVIPDGDGPYGEHKPFNVGLSSVIEVLADESATRIKFCPLCREPVAVAEERADEPGANTRDSLNGEFVCPVHGKLSVNVAVKEQAVAEDTTD